MARSARADGAACQFGEARLGFPQRACEKLAFGPVQLEREGERGLAFPGVFGQQGRPGSEIGQRRRVGRRGLGAPARDQVQLGDPLPLLARGDQRGAAVELADDLEDTLPDRLWRRLGGEPPADGEVRPGPLAFGDQGISRLLDTVVQEAVGLLPPEHQPGSHGLPERCVERRLTPALDQAQGRGRRAVAQAGKLPQRQLGRIGQAAQLAEHKIHDVVRVAFGVDAVEVPVPLRIVMIKGEQTFLGERRHELNDEERIASRLLVHQLGQFGGMFDFAAQRIRNELAHVFSGKRLKPDLRYERACGADCVKSVRQRVRGSDLVVAIGADHQQVLQIRPGQQILQEVERRRVDPLQVVEEERQWMLRPGEHADKSAKHQLETP